MNKSRLSNLEVKRTNKNKIYRYILKNGKLSNQEIAYALRMSIPTVLQNINELISENLVEEAGLWESTGGRKAKAIVALPKAKVAIGIDITENHINLAIVDLQGNILKSMRINKTYKNEELYYQFLGDTLDSFIDDSEVKKDSIIGISFSIPGIVDDDDKLIKYSHVLKQRNLPYGNFSKCIDFPCIFINDANAAGWAEMLVENREKNVFYISLSNSVGGAILMKDHLFKGDNGQSGEIGHMRIEPHGRECYCGMKGCFDAYCSAKVLEETIGDNLEVFFERLEQSDEKCQKAWEEYLDYLAVAVNNIRMLFDCDVVIGGYVGYYMDKYNEKLREKAIELNAFEKDASYIRQCYYKIEAATVGAALHLIEKFISKV